MTLVKALPWARGFMRNIFLFIRRYSTFFFFLILQGVALWFLYSYNKFYRAKFLGVTNEFTGRINSQYNKIEDYFFLKEENRRLNKLNDSLLNMQPGNFRKRDTSVMVFQDTVSYDTSRSYRRYLLRPAVVLYNTVNATKNYIQLNRGANQGITDKMSVVSSDGNAVGVVVNVSPNFSQIMSLLHVQNTVSVALKKTGDFGTIEWDGKDPRYLQLNKIPKTADVQIGDTILTSSVSFNFPPGYMVGTVVEANLNNASGMYSLKVKTAANFYNLQQVHVIENIERPEQLQLFEETKKKVEDDKKK